MSMLVLPHVGARLSSHQRRRADEPSPEKLAREILQQACWCSMAGRRSGCRAGIACGRHTW